MPPARRPRVYHRRAARVSPVVSKLPATLLLACGLGFAGCDDGLEPVERRNADGVVTERYTRNADSLMHGPYEAFDPEGTLLERATYRDGELDGERTLYYPDGGVQAVETHRAGAFDGTYRAYYPDGQLELEGEYVDDVMAGVWTGYYPDGTRKETVTFRDNQENGPFREWYSNGVVKAEGAYLDGDREQGELTLYDLQGEVQRRMFCDTGICRTVWVREELGSDAG